MALAINPIGEEIPVEPERPKIYSEAYKHSIVDSSYQPETSLLGMVNGIPRLMEYYRQFLGADEEPGPFGADNAPTYQSYTRIHKLLGKQDGTGSFAFNPTTGESLGTFEMWIGLDVPPIRYDVAILDIGEGRAGLAQLVEQPEIRSSTANKVYLCTFQILCTLNKDLYEKLDSRVVEELVYSKDSALAGGVSILTKMEFDTAEKLFKWGGTIANYIMSTFYWNSERTIAWEDSDGRKIYDQYLVKFLSSIMPPELRNSYPPIGTFSTQYGGREFGSYGTINIWDVLARGDFNLLPICANSDTVVISVNRLIGTRTYGTLRSSKFSWFVATDPERYMQVKAYFNRDGFPILTPSPEHKVAYLFSPEFYLGKPQSEFEEIVVDVLKDKLVDRKRLLAFCNTYFTLEKYQQLYYGAILLLLIQLSRKFGPAL
jgi:hypothetical protein